MAQFVSIKGTARMKLHVKPIYGWGWFGPKGAPALAVSPDFDFEATVVLPGTPFGTALGLVSKVGHPLDTLWVLLTVRTTDGSGTCNLQAFEQKPDLSAYPEQPPECQSKISGYAVATEAGG